LAKFAAVTGRIFIQVILPLRLEWEPFYYLEVEMSDSPEGAPSMLSVTSTGSAYYAAGAVLFLLMTVFAQTFLAFVRGHLVAFSLFSAGHCVCFWILVSVYVLAC